MNEKDRILTSKEKEAWFRNEVNLPWKPSEQGPTLPSIVHSLTALNLHLHQGFNGRNATSTTDHKQFGAKYNNWRSGPGVRADVAVGSPNTWPNLMEQASHSDKGRNISLQIADINQEQANLTNKQHKDLCAASDCALKWGVRLQEVALTSPTLDSPEKFYDGLPSTADLENDESKISSETEAEVDPADQGRQFKRAQTMRWLRPKDLNMVVNCGWGDNWLCIYKWLSCFISWSHIFYIPLIRVMRREFAFVTLVYISLPFMLSSMHVLSLARLVGSNVIT